MKLSGDSASDDVVGELRGQSMDGDNLAYCFTRRSTRHRNATSADIHHRTIATNQSLRQEPRPRRSLDRTEPSPLCPGVPGGRPAPKTQAVLPSKRPCANAYTHARRQERRGAEQAKSLGIENNLSSYAIRCDTLGDGEASLSPAVLSPPPLLKPPIFSAFAGGLYMRAVCRSGLQNYGPPILGLQLCSRIGSAAIPPPELPIRARKRGI